jgi:hypothetical protein
MTFDEAFKLEAEAFFDTRADLEYSDDRGNTWQPMLDEPVRQVVFADRSRACEIASPSGIRMTNGRAIRFRVLQNMKHKVSDPIGGSFP